jgi:hypothetical protein
MRSMGRVRGVTEVSASIAFVLVHVIIHHLYALQGRDTSVRDALFKNFRPGSHRNHGIPSNYVPLYAPFPISSFSTLHGSTRSQTIIFFPYYRIVLIGLYGKRIN